MQVTLNRHWNGCGSGSRMIYGNLNMYDGQIGYMKLTQSGRYHFMNTLGYFSIDAISNFVPYEGNKVAIIGVGEIYNNAWWLASGNGGEYWNYPGSNHLIGFIAYFDNAGQVHELMAENLSSDCKLYDLDLKYENFQLYVFGKYSSTSLLNQCSFLNGNLPNHSGISSTYTASTGFFGRLDNHNQSNFSLEIWRTIGFSADMKINGIVLHSNEVILTSIYTFLL